MQFISWSSNFVWFLFRWNYVLDLQDDVGNHDGLYRPFLFKSRKQLLTCLSQKSVLNQTDYKLNCEEIEILALGLNFIPDHCGPNKLTFDLHLGNESEQQRFNRSDNIQLWPRRGLLPCSYLTILSNHNQHLINECFENSLESNLNGFVCEHDHDHSVHYSLLWNQIFQGCTFRADHESHTTSTPFSTSISCVSTASSTRFKIEKENAPSSEKRTREKRNISNVVKLLLSQSDFYVVQSDKGGCSVLWKVEDYEKEAFRHLDDQTHYRPLNVVVNSREEEPSSKLFQSPDSSSPSSSIYEERRSSSQHFSLFNEDHLLDRIVLQRDILINKFNIFGYLLQSEFDAMKSVRGKIPYVFFRPKVHKSPRFPDDRLLGRPVVAACSGPLFLLDKYLARLAAPIIKFTKGSLSNTEELVTHMSTIVRSGHSKCATNHEPSAEWMGFAKADVVALYSSIPIEAGIRAAFEVYCIHYWKLCLRAEEEKLYRPVDPYLFENAVRLIVENSYINFQNRFYYHQEKGIAMGSCISVFLANSYMYMLTRGVVERPPGWLRCFLRYVDDFFIFCCYHPSHGEDHLHKMFESISNNDIVYDFLSGQVTSEKKNSEYLSSGTVSLHGRIDNQKSSPCRIKSLHVPSQDFCQEHLNKYEMTLRREQEEQRLENISRTCTFLDVDMKFDEKRSKLDFRPYFNEFLAPTYLHRTSHHSSNHFKNVPFSQFVRIKKLSSSRTTFLKASQVLKKILISRGYSHGEIRRSLQQAERSNTFNYFPNDNRNVMKIDKRNEEDYTIFPVNCTMSINFQSTILSRYFILFRFEISAMWFLLFLLYFI